MNEASSHSEDCDWASHKLLVVDKLGRLETMLSALNTRLDGLFLDQTKMIISHAEQHTKSTTESSLKKWMWPTIISIFGLSAIAIEIIVKLLDKH